MVSIRELVARRIFERQALRKPMPMGFSVARIIENLLCKEPGLEKEIGPKETPLSRARAEAELRVRTGQVKR